MDDQETGGQRNDSSGNINRRMGDAGKRRSRDELGLRRRGAKITRTKVQSRVDRANT
jgi:hypothetical protein